jgi:AraC-like DNA-binding protein
MIEKHIIVEKHNIKEGNEGFLFLYKSGNHQKEMKYPHRHVELEMNLIIKGSAEYILSNQCYKLTRGSIVWLFPGQHHQLCKTDDDFEMYVAVFKEELFKKIFLKKVKYSTLSRLNPEGSFCRRMSLASTDKLEKICLSLCELNEKNILSPAYYYAGQAFGFKQNSEYFYPDPILLNAGLLYLMTIGWHLFITEGNNEKQKNLNPLIDKAINLLQKFPEKNYGLTELSAECSLSSSLFSRLFNEQIGLSIVDYKNRLKLEEFIDCIQKNPDFSISEACYISGFGSYSQFYKIFKQKFDVSPRVYFSK